MADCFVNGDWGTSHFRLRLVDLDRVTIAAEVCCDEGVAPIAARCQPSRRPAEFQRVLAHGLRTLGEKLGRPLGPIPVVISGMASSSIGWHELPYAPVPWRVDGSDLVWHELDPLVGADGPHRTILVSGARTATDIMRGEETQLVGLCQWELSGAPGGPTLAERATVILPGTHSKHLRAERGQIVDFRTFMTGELMDVISRASTLRHSIGQHVLSADHLSGDGLAAFQAGLELAREVPLSAALFRVRARHVLDAASEASNRALLSGILIGGELSYLARDQARDSPLVLCAAAPLDGFYAAALDHLGLSRCLTVIVGADAERLSALGQACLVRRLDLI